MLNRFNETYDRISKRNIFPVECKKERPPRFKTRHRLQLQVFGYLGHRMRLKCPHRKGCPRADVKWFKNGELLRKREGTGGLSSIYIEDDGRLIIDNNFKEDDGKYT